MERVIIPGALDKEHSCPISLRLTYRQAGHGLGGVYSIIRKSHKKYKEKENAE